MAGTKSPVFDWDKGEFKTDSQGRVIVVENAAALEQIVIKINSTPRGVFLIYADPANPEQNHKYGTDTMDVMLRTDITDEVRESELKRAVRDALVFDPLITDVTDITVYQAAEKDGVVTTYADFTLVTVFDKQTVKGAVINA